MKKKAVLLAAIIATLAMSVTAYAGSWKQDAAGWRWQNDDGSYLTGSWQWLDGNGDGVAESYCFDANGYLYVNTTTPDGYTVNADGAWMENGIVKTQTVSARTDFAQTKPVGGESSVAGSGTAFIPDIILDRTNDEVISSAWARMGDIPAILNKKAANNLYSVLLGRGYNPIYFNEGEFVVEMLGLDRSLLNDATFTTACHVLMGNEIGVTISACGCENVERLPNGYSRKYWKEPREKDPNYLALALAWKFGTIPDDRISGHRELLSGEPIDIMAAIKKQMSDYGISADIVTERRAATGSAAVSGYPAPTHVIADYAVGNETLAAAAGEELRSAMQRIRIGNQKYGGLGDGIPSVFAGYLDEIGGLTPDRLVGIGADGLFTLARDHAQRDVFAYYTTSDVLAVTGKGDSRAVIIYCYDMGLLTAGQLEAMGITPAQTKEVIDELNQYITWFNSTNGRDWPVSA